MNQEEEGIENKWIKDITVKKKNPQTNNYLIFVSWIFIRRTLLQKSMPDGNKATSETDL